MTNTSTLIPALADEDPNQEECWITLRFKGEMDARRNAGLVAEQLAEHLMVTINESDGLLDFDTHRVEVVEVKEEADIRTASSPREPRYECQDCGTEFTDDDADCDDGENLKGFRSYIHHIGDRVAPGEPMPAGECNLCGALVSLVEDDDDDALDEAAVFGEEAIAEAAAALRARRASSQPDTPYTLREDATDLPLTEAQHSMLIARRLVYDRGDKGMRGDCSCTLAHMENCNHDVDTAVAYIEGVLEGAQPITSSPPAVPGTVEDRVNARMQGLSAALLARTTSNPSAAPVARADLVAALQAGRDLIEEAMSSHIYDAANGEQPDADCPYAAHVALVDKLLGDR